MQQPVHEGYHTRNLPPTSYTVAIFIFRASVCTLQYFRSSHFFFFCFVACFHSFTPSTTFFFLCYRDLPVNQFNPNFLPSISTKTARNEFQLPLNYSFFGITEFSRSNTGFSTLTLKKYPIDPVMSWFIKRCKSCLSFSCCQSC